MLIVFLLLILGAAAAPLGPVDPPFDLTRVLFSSAFSSHAVLQRAPQQAAVFGTATPGASVSVTLAGPQPFSAAPVTVTSSADPALHGTWKVLLPARPAGFGYSIAASCSGCSNATSAPAALADIGFGDVYVCSGQSNMECPVLTTTAHYDVFNTTASGAYDHMRLFQTGWRFLGPRNASSWILPPLCTSAHCANNTEPSNPRGGYAYRSWLLPSSAESQSDDDSGANAGHFPDRFSAVCWYFGKSLSDKMAAAAAEGSSEPVPIGLISSTIGGTTMQEWMPPSATGNDTCTENNCGWVEQPVSELPACSASNSSDVWSCPSSACSTLWHSMIAPFVNVTIAGVVWYQGEQNVLFGRGSSASGYQCQQAALIRSWREAFSAVPNTTASDFPFGVTTLAGGASEGGYLWNPFSHIPLAQWEFCQGRRFTEPICKDIVADWTASLRAAQTGGYGFAPNPALPNVFIGQNYDQGEPCGCDKTKPAPGGCWASNVCFGDGPLSLNRTHNYQNSGIHPRVKDIVGERLARALMGLRQGAPQPTPKLSGCRISGQQLVLSFDAKLLGAEGVSLQPYPLWTPTSIPLEFQIAPANETDGSSGWVYATSLAVMNATSISAPLPAGVAAPTAVRYAWGDYACCPGMDPSTFYCPPTSCPIVTERSTEPAVPFWAAIVSGKCECDAPFDCSA
jgi:hypothetical protein